MSFAAQIVIALAIFAAGAAGGIKWHAGQDARAELAAREARESDARQQRALNDRASTRQAAALATINNQLGNAREKIANLSGRACLDAGTVGVLNAIGADDVRGTAPQPAPEGGPVAARASYGAIDGADHSAGSSGTGLRYSTDKDLAGYIAVCRARYAAVASQVNQIQDIEDRRHGPVGQ